MNINLKNCKVQIYTEMETINISTRRTYTLAGFMANCDKVKIGDRVKLPAFTVPAVKTDSDEAMNFDEQNIEDEAIVIGKDENGDFILIFDHCLFESAIDLNGEKRFEKTQLGLYLQWDFLSAMNSAGIPAESCGLISRDEMFGGNALEYFKKGRNRIAFDLEEDCSRPYWLSTLCNKEVSAACFCFAGNRGHAGYYYASSAVFCVRPRFVIRKS